MVIEPCHFLTSSVCRFSGPSSACLSLDPPIKLCTVDGKSRRTNFPENFKTSNVAVRAKGANENDASNIRLYARVGGGVHERKQTEESNSFSTATFLAVTEGAAGK